jgi:hypothetical protein
MEFKLTNDILNNLTINSIRSVYSGARGKCCCGCSGNHRYASAHVDESTKNRGYDVDPSEVSDRSVKTVFSKIIKNFEEGVSDAYLYVSESFGSHITLFHGNRTYVLYLTENSSVNV